MRKIQILALLVTLVLAGCSSDNGGSGGTTYTFGYTPTDEIGRILVPNPTDWRSCTPVGDPQLPPVNYGPVPAYPNPTNGVCLLGFTIPAPREVTVSIWQPADEKVLLLDPAAAPTLVMILTTGRHVAGRHQLRWDGKDNLGNCLPPGPYLCRFETIDCASTGEIRLIACPYGTDRLLGAAMLAHLDAHWSLDRLTAAFDPNYFSHAGADPAFANVAGFGLEYFPFVDPGDDPQALPLYVSRSDDLALFVENVAMWNQFVFGWDDFVDPRIYYDDIDPNNLSDGRVSAQREHFRGNK